VRRSSLGAHVFGEAAPDMPDFGNVGVERAENVIPRKVGFAPLPTFVATSNASGVLPSKALGAISVRDPSDGTPYTYAGTASGLWSLTGGIWTDVTQSGYTHSAEGRWSFTQFGSQVIATNGVVSLGATGDDVPQVITLGGTNFADLVTTPADPPRGRYVALVRDFVVYARMNDGGTEHRRRVQWSAYKDPTLLQFSAPKMSDFQDLDASGGDCTGVTSGETGIVFQEDATWRMSRTGGTKVFRFDRVRETIGCIAPGSIVRHDNIVYWLSRDGFRALQVNSGNTSSAIGEERVDLTVLSELDTEELDGVSAAAWPEKSCVVFAYPGPGNNGSANRLAIFNYSENKWALGDEALDILVRIYSEFTTLANLQTLYGNLSDVPGSLNDPIYGGGVINFGGISQDGFAGAFVGAPGTALIETGETQFNGSRTLITGVRPIVDGGTVSIRVGTRSKQSGAVTWTNASAENSAGWCPLRSEGRYHRAEVSITGDFKHAIGIEPYGGETGQR
jgi:hypothetical protein